ncbi:hypothetical protein [Anaerovibrio sp. RM50]|uniref:hypothetical protein n=1 Tax=Anaerovibrio sp. RM50 TaxID=1200557 RepID=UPI000487E2C7|nr:hypothetical protein [Anaerovibrio sp. RM50]
MKFNVVIQEVYEKKIAVEAENWREALMKTNKEHDRGAFIFEDDDLKECNVGVDGWPYQIFDKWTIEDVEEYVKNHPAWSKMNLSENETRQALHLMEMDDDKKGFSWTKMDKELAIVINNRQH